MFVLSTQQDQITPKTKTISMTKTFWGKKDWFRDVGYKSLDQEMSRIIQVKARFQKKRDSIDPNVLLRYPLAEVNKIVKAASERNKSKVIGQARELGFSPNITLAYTIKGESHQKSVLEQAKDYMKLLLSTDFYLDRILASTVARNIGCPCFVGYGEGAKPPTLKLLPKAQQTDRKFYYDYFDHLSQ